MEVVQLRGSQGFWQLQVRRGVGGWGSRKCGALEGMAASVGHYAPVFLPGDPPTEEPGRPQSTGSQSQTGLKRPCIHKHRIFFAGGSSAPVRVEREGGAAAWLCGTLTEHRLPPRQELWPDQSLFSSLL